MIDAVPRPARAGAVLATLILVAAVANLPLSVANVALPDIGRAFDASQTMLNLVAVGYSLGLAASVLWFGAVGDRYGRRRMLLIGVLVSLPAGLVAAFAPSVEVLVAARILGGIAAGMAYPTTLALITALWSGAARTRAIALWSAVGGAISALGPLVAGWILEAAPWGWVFLVTVPLIAAAVPLVLLLIPAHVNESTEPIDNLGGVLSSVLVAAAVLAINSATVPGQGTLALVLSVVAVVALIAFAWRQRQATNPLYDLHIARRPIFWVAALAGVIVFGSLMAALFVGQQFLQNVLGYSTLESGAAILPGALAMVVFAPLSARLIESLGARITLLIGFAAALLSFLTMLLLWHEGAPPWVVWVTYALMGAGVGLAGTPASRSLTSAVPVTRAGMASGTADLQRDLGGAIMQSLLGALLTAGYAASFARQIAASPEASQISDQVQAQLQRSFSSAQALAERYPQYGDAITTAARASFLEGQGWAYLAGVVSVAVGAIVVAIFYPRHARERELIEEYQAADAASRGGGATTAATGA